MNEDLLQQIEAEMERQERKEALTKCLAAENINTRPNETQTAILRSFSKQAKYIFCLGGNQCLAKGTEVLTTLGIKPIEDVVVGDTVYDENGNEIKVIATHDNGLREVVDLVHRQAVVASCTLSHVFLTQNSSNVIEETAVKDFDSDTKIVQRYIPPYLEEPKPINVEIKLTNRLVQTYDITVDSPRNLYCLANGLVTHNSGKTATLVRQLVWMLDDTHPFWERPNDTHCNNRLCGSTNLEQLGDKAVPIYRCRDCSNLWKPWPKTEPLNLILCGENRLNLMQNLWEPRIKPLLLEPEKWKPIKLGPYVGWIEHLELGHKVLFFPHGHGVEQARKAVQGFTIHAVFMDELAGLKVIEELQRRVDARLGYFMTAFTMKTIDAEVARYLRKAEQSGAAQIFKISKLDNPIYAGMKDLILAQLEGYSEADRNKILYGEITDSDDQVFKLTEDMILEPELPVSYSTSWRHVEVVDPAIQSKAGYILFAENPEDLTWHIIKAGYITGMQDAQDLYREANLRSMGANVVKHVSDEHAWYIGYAKKQGTRYVTPPNKKTKGGGKIFMIKRAQMFMSAGRLKIPKQFEDLLDELDTYRWKEGSSEGAIVNSHKYHLIDCLVYFVDTLPRGEVEQLKPLTWAQEIMMYNRKKLANPTKKPLQTMPRDVHYLRGDTLNDVFKRLGIKKW